MMEWITAALAGAITGVLSGFGIGGGSLLLIYMTSFAGVEQNLAQGINLLYFLPTAATALPAHIKNGYIDRQTVWPAVLAGLAGTALAVVLSVTSHIMAGAVFFAQYAWDGYGPWAYSILANLSGHGTEGLLTIVLVSVLPIRHLQKAVQKREVHA